MPQFDAIGVTIADMAKTLAFYRLLGLEFPEGAESEGHVEAELPGGFRVMFDTIEVIESFTTHEPPTGGRDIHFAFSCGSPANVDETFQQIVDAGHAVKAPPFDAVWGQRYATVFDPDGNPVDLYAPLG